MGTRSGAEEASGREVTRGKARDRDSKTLPPPWSIVLWCSHPWSMVLWCSQTLRQACVFSAVGEGEENKPTLNKWLDWGCVIWLTSPELLRVQWGQVIGPFCSKSEARRTGCGPLACLLLDLLPLPVKSGLRRVIGRRAGPHRPRSPGLCSLGSVGVG